MRLDTLVRTPSIQLGEIQDRNVESDWGGGGDRSGGWAVISNVNYCTMNRIMHKCVRGKGRGKGGDAAAGMREGEETIIKRQRCDVRLRRKCVVVKRYTRRILCHNM